MVGEYGSRYVICTAAFSNGPNPETKLKVYQPVMVDLIELSFTSLSTVATTNQ